MAAQLIPVSVYALDQFDLADPSFDPEREAPEPVLRGGAEVGEMALVEGDWGLALGADLALAGEAWAAGAGVTLAAVPHSRSWVQARVDGRAVALIRPGLEVDAPEHLAAFVVGTLIDTPDGPRPVEALQAGDRVTTLANGSRPVLWVGRRRVRAVEMLIWPGLRPLVLPPGMAGNDRALVLSPRQRLLIDDWRAEVYFGEDRVLVAAEALADPVAHRLPLSADGVEYVMLLCDRHEILLAEGGLSESFHPGEAGLAALTADERASLASVVAEAELGRRRAAYPIVRTAEARAMRLSG